MDIVPDEDGQVGLGLVEAVLGRAFETRGWGGRGEEGSVEAMSRAYLYRLAAVDRSLASHARMPSVV